MVAGLTTVVMLTTVAGQPAWAQSPSTTSAVTASNSLVADPTNLATDEDKVAAARVLGINPGIDMLVLNDQEFVFSIWRQARDGSFVKAGALRTYESDDPNAAYAFITVGIFAASADDAQAEIIAERAKALRRSVAVTVGLDPSDTALIEKNDRDFIFSVWQRVTAGSHVWTAARDAIADGTDQEDWTAFLTVGAAAAHAQDVADAIAQADAELAARLAAEQLATAKKSLLQLLLLAVTDELVAAPNRQFVLHVHNNAKGVEVKLASQVALNAPDEQLDQALKDFIFTGGAAANKRDEDIAAAKELAGYVTQITKIRDDARTDGYSPNLLAAAERALADNTLVATQTFLLKGQEDARALDVVFRQKRTWDFDGNKKPDIVAADSATGILWLYNGKGDGTLLGTRTNIGTGWAKWTAVFSPGDFNGDGLNDVITRSAAGELLLYRGNGTGRWLNGTAPDKIGSSGWQAFTSIFSPGDFNGDGFADVIVRNSAGQLKLYRGNGRGGWQNGTAPDTIGTSGWNQYTAMFSPGDFNGDGFADLIARNSAGELKLYRGNGRGAWLNGTAPETIGTGWNKWNMIFSSGDVNSDGRADVIVRNSAGELRLYRGNGKGGWIDPTSNILIGRSGWSAFKFVF
ncbi:VCBS repeat-containing protein [Micromonospora endolithica]|uniref:VCBS repeat-containing protein n=1 Tax=Micromonospora endolithica TaxID=230091 RepID=A0A3A9ZJK7_9ACTN|nr:VCBS repeat-containing protein [Micromonospora endolithica]